MNTAFLDLDELAVTLGGKSIVQPLSLGVARGEMMALIGPNGAGKTSLLRAIAGLIPASGNIRLAGQDLGAIPLRRRGRLIAYLPQGQTVHWPMRVADVVALGRLPHRRSLGRLTAEDDAAIDQAIAMAGLSALRERQADTLSAGELARVLMARALAVGAPLFLADEPIAALDPYHQLGVMELLRRQTRSGASVIAVLHDLGLAAQFCDRVAMLDGGRLVAIGPPETVLTPALIETVYGIRPVTEPGSALAPFGPFWARVDRDGA
jgi:iron complex transport system ATP-binding protein